jgi:hypothetical protein
MPRISLDLIQQPLFLRPRGVRGCHLANLGLQMQPVWRPKILTNPYIAFAFLSLKWSAKSASFFLRNLHFSRRGWVTPFRLL